MSFPTVYYITQVIPPCYSAGNAMCVCVSFGACVYSSLAGRLVCISFLISVCMFIVSKALLISSATVIVRAGGGAFG